MVGLIVSYVAGRQYSCSEKGLLINRINLMLSQTLESSLAGNNGNVLLLASGTFLIMRLSGIMGCAMQYFISFSKAVAALRWGRRTCRFSYSGNEWMCQLSICHFVYFVQFHKMKKIALLGQQFPS